MSAEPKIVYVVSCRAFEEIRVILDHMNPRDNRRLIELLVVNRMTTK